MLLRLALASAGVLCLAGLSACNGDDNSSPDGGSMSTLPDAPPPMVDGGMPLPSCKPADVTAFHADPYHAARPQPNTCTTDQVNRFYADCLAPGTTADTCGPFLAADAGAADQLCAACIISRPADPTYGPIIYRGAWDQLNVAGCLELTDSTALACAKSYQAAEECEDQACKDNCPVTSDPGTLGAYQTCTNLAASVGCENFSGPAACVTQHSGICSGDSDAGAGSFQQSFSAFALLFCGPHDGGAPPPSDAGAKDATITDGAGE